MKLFQNLSEKSARRAVIGLLTAGAALFAGTLYFRFGRDTGHTVTTYSMGSYVQQTIYGSGKEEAAQKAANAVAELEDLISWRKEDSDVARINDKAGEDFVAADNRTLTVLETALSVCEASGGAFDVTIAPLSRLWNFDETPHLPEAGKIEKMLSRVDYTVLSLPGDGTAALRKSGYALDLGAVGKGAACDAAREAYAAAGVERAVVAVGGSVGVYGEKPFGKPWKIAVRDPAGEGSLGTLSIWKGCVSTSGSYEKQFTQDGKTYHHLLDPDTGYPAESGLTSVTVWSESGALSDALATACFVLGLEKGLPLLEEFGAEGVLITEDKRVIPTDGLKSDFVLENSGYTLEEFH